MDCPYCRANSRVIDSRPTADGIRRRRVCESCKRRFTTHERALAVPVRVIKSRGRPAEDFDLEKLRRTIERLAKGRSIPSEEIEDIARSVEVRVLDSGRGTVSSRELAGTLSEILQDRDEMMYARLVSNYIDLRERVSKPEKVQGDIQIEMFNELNTKKKK